MSANDEVTMKEVERLRLQADRWTRLAQITTDESAAQILYDLAAESFMLANDLEHANTERNQNEKSDLR